MNLLKWSTIFAPLLTGVFTLGATPAEAIVGGQDATQHYPGETFVTIYYPGVGTAQCGGTLINPRYVLTAAHCITDEFVAPTVSVVPADRVTVYIGNNDRTKGLKATASKIMPMPDWQWLVPTGRPVSDLGLIELTHSVPARLMPLRARHVRPSNPLRLIGWGLIDFPVPAGYPLPTMLHQRDITALPASACAGGAIGAGELCTSTGACFGDSGSPALSPTHTGPGRRPQWREVGLGSRETTDQDPNANPCTAPMIYTDLTFKPFATWITDTIRTGHTKPCTNRPTTHSLDTAARNRLDQLKPKITR